MIFTLVGCGLVIRALGANFLHDVWNPYIPVLPFGLLLFLTWAMTCGDRWALPLAAGVASFCRADPRRLRTGRLPVAGMGGCLVARARPAPRRDPGPPAIPEPGASASSRPASSRSCGHRRSSTRCCIHPATSTACYQYFREPPGRRATHNLVDGYRIRRGPVRDHARVAHGGRPAESGQLRLRRSSRRRRFRCCWSRSASPLRAVAPADLRRRADCWPRSPWRPRRSAWCPSARVIGPVYAYRIRWTWMLAVALVPVVAWAAWVAVSDRRPNVPVSDGRPNVPVSDGRPKAAARWFVPVAVSVLVVLATVRLGERGARRHAPATRGVGRGGARAHDLRPAAARRRRRHPARRLARGQVLPLGLVLSLEHRGVAARRRPVAGLDLRRPPRSPDGTGAGRPLGGDRPPRREPLEASRSAGCSPTTARCRSRNGRGCWRAWRRQTPPIRPAGSPTSDICSCGSRCRPAWALRFAVFDTGGVT